MKPTWPWPTRNTTSRDLAQLRDRITQARAEVHHLTQQADTTRDAL